MFPEILKKTRLEKNLTQSSIASSLGISQASYFKWEKGITEPTQKNLKKLADLLDVTTDYLLGNTGIPNTSIQTNGDNNTISHKNTNIDNSKFKNNKGNIDINYLDHQKTFDKLPDNKNLISLLEQLLKNQESILKLLSEQKKD